MGYKWSRLFEYSIDESNTLRLFVKFNYPNHDTQRFTLERLNGKLIHNLNNNAKIRVLFHKGIRKYESLGLENTHCDTMLRFKQLACLKSFLTTIMK